MPTIRVDRTIAAAPQRVWRLLQDFASIDVFNPNLAGSHRIGGTPHEGIGAERHCDMKDGRNWIRERVIDWRPGEGYTVEIFAGTLPITDIRTTLRVEPDGAASHAFMQIAYRPKYGLLGQVLDAMALRRMMRRLMERVLDGLSEKAEEKLPVGTKRAA